MFEILHLSVTALGSANNTASQSKDFEALSVNFDGLDMLICLQRAGFWGEVAV